MLGYHRTFWQRTSKLPIECPPAQQYPSKNSNLVFDRQRSKSTPTTGTIPRAKEQKNAKPTAAFGSVFTRERNYRNSSMTAIAPIEKEERACDEEVLSVARDPQIYAEGILNVCKFYLDSPLICASGVTGADLKKRIEKIMTHRNAHNLDWRRKSLLAAAGVAAVVGPVAVGVMWAQSSVAQSQTAGATLSAFEVASVKLNKSANGRNSKDRSRGGDLAPRMRR
jgi:hypothetical protein